MDRVRGLPIGPEHVVDCSARDVPLCRYVRRGELRFALCEGSGVRSLNEKGVCKLFCPPEGAVLFDFGNNEFIYAVDGRPATVEEFIGHCFAQDVELASCAHSSSKLGLDTKIFSGAFALLSLTASAAAAPWGGVTLGERTTFNTTGVGDFALTLGNRTGGVGGGHLFWTVGGDVRAMAVNIHAASAANSSSVVIPSNPALGGGRTHLSATSLPNGGARVCASEKNGGNTAFESKCRELGPNGAPIGGDFDTAPINWRSCTTSTDLAGIPDPVFDSRLEVRPFTGSNPALPGGPITVLEDRTGAYVPTRCTDWGVGEGLHGVIIDSQRLVVALASGSTSLTVDLLSGMSDFDFGALNGTRAAVFYKQSSGAPILQLLAKDGGEASGIKPIGASLTGRGPSAASDLSCGAVNEDTLVCAWKESDGVHYEIVKVANDQLESVDTGHIPVTGVGRVRLATVGEEAFFTWSTPGQIHVQSAYNNVTGVPNPLPPPVTVPAPVPMSVPVPTPTPTPAPESAPVPAPAAEPSTPPTTPNSPPTPPPPQPVPPAGPAPRSAPVAVAGPVAPPPKSPPWGLIGAITGTVVFCGGIAAAAWCWLAGRKSNTDSDEYASFSAPPPSTGGEGGHPPPEGPRSEYAPVPAPPAPGAQYQRIVTDEAGGYELRPMPSRADGYGDLSAVRVTDSGYGPTGSAPRRTHRYGAAPVNTVTPQSNPNSD